MRTPAVVSPRFTLLAPALLVLFSSGCVRTHVTRVARFEPRDAASDVQKPAPRSDTYKVKYATTSGGMRTHGGTRRIVGRGDVLGFATLPDGRLVAVAGEEQIPLDKLPPTVRYCVWTAKEKKPTQFTKELGKAGATAAAGALVGGAVLGIATLGAAGVAADAYLNRDEDDDCEERRREEEKEDRRAKRLTGRGYRWVGQDGGVPPKGSGDQ